MSSSQHDQSQIVAFGDINSYKQLFNRINEKFNSTQLANTLQIVECNQNYQLKIKTKYYDLDSLLVVKPFDCIDGIEQQFLEGVFILLDNTSSYHKNEIINQLFEQNEMCFKAIIYSVKNEQITELTEKFDDLIQIELDLSNQTNDDQEKFDGLDEFVNSLFVHTWFNMELKSEPKTEPIKPHKEEALKEDENSDDENFNFESMISNLSEMRDKANGLSFEERKLYAENIVKKFWLTIGGNEEEIDDLTSNDL